MSQLKSSCKLDQCAQSFLLKEYWNAPSDLTVTDKKIINFDNLLCMYEICNISFFINASIKVSCTCFPIRSSWYENIGYFCAFNKDLKAINIALYYRKTPLFLNFIFIQLSEKTFVPSKSVFYSHLLVLEWLSEIVFVRKIEAMPKDFINLSDFFKNLFFLRFERKFSVAQVTKKIQWRYFINHQLLNVCSNFCLIT